MTAEELVGQQLSNYYLESILGSGGMATVFRARAPENEVVALKVLFPPAGFGPEMAVRFEREAQTAARLNHPAIVPVLNVGRSGSHAFIVMQFIKGHSLAERLSQVGRLDERAAADIAWQIADALDYAHNQGVVHRDIKPANILLTPDDRALLTDFGVALALDDPALTRTGYIVGTPAYISPEQAAGQRPIDGRADLYALGVVLYEMVTGHIPFQGSTPHVLYAHVHEAPPVPSASSNVSGIIENVILRALAKDPMQRFQAGLEMAQALAKLGSQASTRTDHSPPPTRTMHHLPSQKRSLAEPSLTTPHLQRPAMPSENPFFYGGTVSPELFYGRRDLLQTAVRRLGARSAQSISIVGARRMGKSSLLNYIKANADHYFPANVLIVYLDLMKAYGHSRAGLMKALRRALTQAWREPWPAAEDGDLMAFDFALEELQTDGRRLLLFLDEVENLTQRADEFNDVLEDWRACAQLGQMGILAASAQPLADLCELGGLTSPFYNIFSQHRLGLLAQEDWQALVTEHMNASGADLAFIEKVAGGHPFLTQMAASYVWEAQVNDAVDYDRLYEELWHQIQPHLRHLWRSLTSPEQLGLRQTVGLDGGDPDLKIVAALERQAILKDAQPFSQLFAEMIRQGDLNG